MSLTHWLSGRLGLPSRIPGLAVRPASKRKAPARRPAFRPRLEYLEDRLTPSTFTVTTARDEFDGGTAANAAGADGQLSLREAISAASSGDQITFSQSLSGSTINLDPTRGELLINKNLDILGLGAANLAVSGQNQIRVFDVASGATDSISGLTIENGFVTGLNYGGGILNAGTLVVSDSTLSSNHAVSGYGYAAGYDYGNGGGIYNAGTLTVSGSTISSNSADISGGGILNYGALVASGCTLSSNSAIRGGGIYNSGGTLTVDGCTLSSNSAGQGGGIGSDSRYGTVTIRGCTFSSNSAANGGGIGIYSGTVTVTDSTLIGNAAPYAGYGAGGGGIYNSGGTLTVDGCSLSGNVSAHGHGGGIYNDYNGTLTVSGSTLSGNSAASGGGIYNDGTATVAGSTLTGNTGYSGGGIDNYLNGMLTLDNCTLSDNSAVVYGGGIGSEYCRTTTVSDSTLTNNSASYGGGIYNYEVQGSTLNLTGSTLTGNSATNQGGGIDNDVGPVNITDSTVCGNFAPIGADVSNHSPGLLALKNSDVCAIAQATITTAISSSDSSVFGQVVTFTATVLSPDDGRTPTGTVTFLNEGNDTVLGVGTLNSSGYTTFTTSTLSVGSYFIAVVYNGAATFADSTTFLEHDVLSAQQELSLVINQVTNLVVTGVLSSQNGNALIVKLNNAITSLDKGNTVTGVNQLDAFINQTNALLKSSKLDSTDAQTLISDIDEAIAAALASPF